MRLRTLLAAGVIATGGLVALPNSANAAGVNCAADSANFAGWYDGSNTTSPNVEGVSATFNVQGTHLCASESMSSNTSSAWALIAENIGHADNRGVPGGAAQDGFIMNPSHLSPWFFYEGDLNDIGNSTPVFWNAATTGQYHRFWTQFVGNTASYHCPGSLTGCFAYNVDVTRIGASAFDPYSAWGYPSAPNEWAQEFAGEVHNPQSDIPGRTSVSPINYGSLQVQSSGTGSYNPAPCVYTSIVSVPIQFKTTLGGDHSGGCGSWSISTNY